MTEEDLLAAGAILDAASRLPGANGDLLDATAAAAIGTFRACLARGGEVVAESIATAFADSRGGRNLLELGMQADLPAAAAIDSLPVVPRLDPRGDRRETADVWLQVDAAASA